jgi:hypothetical protein
MSLNECEMYDYSSKYQEIISFGFLKDKTTHAAREDGKKRRKKLGGEGGFQTRPKPEICLICDTL